MNDGTVGVPTAPVRLWIPGVGDVDPRVRRVALAVRDYDSDMKLARHELTGDWVVFHERGHTGEPFPLFGFGKELPHPDDVEQILAKHDIKRRGDEFMQSVRKRNEIAEKAAKDEYEEAAGIAAEQLAFYMQRDRGVKSRIYVP